MREYTTAVVFHFEKAVEQPEGRHAWSRGVNQDLVKLERAVFLAGYRKAFLLGMDSCGLCDICPGLREECRHPRSGRERGFTLTPALSLIGRGGSPSPRPSPS